MGGNIDSGDMEVLKEALAKWGIKRQLGMLQEECGELIVAVSHYLRERIGLDDLATEVADVEIMCGQFRAHAGYHSVDAARKEKIGRLRRKLGMAPPVRSGDGSGLGMEEEKACGGCRWWEELEANPNGGKCSPPIPRSILGDFRFNYMAKSADATKCPCFVLRGPAGSLPAL